MNKHLAWIGVLVGLLMWKFAAGQPNIVVYLSDDHSQVDSSLYGSKHIPTPNFEKLAADGMTFTHAFVASPSCAPSRAAMLTGLTPVHNGAQANHTFPTSKTHSLIEELKKLGYETAAFGKVAHGKGRQVARYGFDHTDPGRSAEQLRKTVPAYLKGRDGDKPLCLFVGISNPHVIWPDETSFKKEEVVLPPTFLDTPDTRRLRAMYLEEVKELDAVLAELRMMAKEHLGNDVLFIHTSDHGAQWPFGKWTLYDYGTRVPFIASWPGKIKPGTRTDAMVSWLDLLPTLIDAAGGKVPKGIDGRSFAAVLRGQETTHRDRIFTTQTGDGRMNIYPSRAIHTDGWKLIHNLRPEFAFTSHTTFLRRPNAGSFWTEWAELAKTDARAKAVVNRYYKRPEFELYHVAEDHWEQNNLAGAPQHAKRLASLKSELQKWMVQQGDEGFVHAEPRLLSDKESWHPDYFGTKKQRKD